MATATLTQPETDVEETEQQKKNRLRNEAEREVLNAHRDELNTITEAKFRANNLVYTRRLTDSEKAARKVEEYFNQFPELRRRFAAPITGDFTAEDAEA
jgi:hypothetical protein